MNTSLQNLLTIVFLFLMGNLLASGAIMLLGLAEGVTLEQISSMGSDPSAIPESMLRGMLWIQSVCVFILPAIVYWMIRPKRSSFMRSFDLTHFPTFLVLGISLLVLLAGYPLVHASYVLNNVVPLPEWATTLEDSASEILGSVLEMDSFVGYLSALLIVAVLPAIGEELVFRGIIQVESGELVNNRVAGIWISAFLFSLIHFQFEGFLPRLFLGAILGYLYYYTRTLWVPIIAHFINNGFQVTLLYVAGIDLNAANEEEASITWWVVILSVMAFASLIRLLKRQAKSAWTETI